MDFLPPESPAGRTGNLAGREGNRVLLPGGRPGLDLGRTGAEKSCPAIPGCCARKILPGNSGVVRAEKPAPGANVAPPPPPPRPGVSAPSLPRAAPPPARLPMALAISPLVISLTITASCAGEVRRPAQDDDDEDAMISLARKTQSRRRPNLTKTLVNFNCSRKVQVRIF